MTPPEGPHGSGGPGAHAVAPFREDMLRGLAATPKRLSPKYFYDQAGALLFDAICDLPEYYPTRAELSIVEAHVHELTAQLGDRVRVVEPGAGSGTKVRLLLKELGPERCTEYLPVDIAGEHLAETARQLRVELPWLRVAPFAGDFTVHLPEAATDGARTLVYFPGSTLGNFEPADAERLLVRFGRLAGADGAVLLGVDLKKDPRLLHAAYNDAQGVTAAFNRNVLVRMNRELGADFDLDAFAHYAFFEPRLGRVEMHLVSLRRQTVRVAGHPFDFELGESIHTECSYKYDLRSIERLAESAKLALSKAWLDEDHHFAVLLLRPTP
jgi:L-histidine Nalpha-methyltransferase